MNFNYQTMKKFSLFLLGTFFFFQFGCKKDEPIQNDVQGKSRITESIDDNALPLERNACFEIPELCASGPPYVSTPDEPFDPTTSFGPPKVLSLQGYPNNANPIRIKDGDMVYWVYGYEIFENSTDYVVMNQNSEVFFLSETDDPYLQSKNEVGVLSNKLIDVIPLINHENLENGSLTENAIRSSFESNIPLTTFPNGKFEIDITNRTPSGNPQASVITWSWCKWVVPATVRKYKKQLASTYNIINPASQLDKAIEESIESCHDDLCEYCTDTRCIVDAMINNDAISGANLVVEDIKLNYLRLLLDLTDEQIDELKDDTDFVNDIFNFASNCNNLTLIKNAIDVDCPGFVACVKDAITNEIFTKLGITDIETKNLIRENPEVWGNLLTEQPLIPVGDGTIINLVNPNSLCPNAFTPVIIDPKDPDPNNPNDDDPTNPNPPYYACIIGGLNIQFNFPGTTNPVTVGFGWLKFRMELGCPSPSQVFASSMQQAYVNMQAIINSSPNMTQNPNFLRQIFILQFEAECARQYEICSDNAGNMTNPTTAKTQVELKTINTVNTSTTSGSNDNALITPLEILTNQTTGLTTLDNLGCP